MVEDDGAVQWEWEPLLEAALRADIDGDDAAAAWNELENWWRDTRRWDDAYKPSLRALLERLRSIVPRIPDENGMERTTRYLQPSDPEELWEGKEHLRPAAEILHIGELEAVVEREPAKASESWSEHREMIAKHLNDYLHSSEPTSGDKSLSRRMHASVALELLSHLDVVEDLASHELTDETDHDWLTELVAEIAFAAFEAGRRTQAAWGKEFERYVPTGKAVQDGQRKGAASRRLQTSVQSEAVLDCMDALIAEGKNISSAARITEKRGIGTSEGANRAIYHRRKKKKL
jgi:hypothetical protein